MVYDFGVVELKEIISDNDDFEPEFKPKSDPSINRIDIEKRKKSNNRGVQNYDISNLFHVHINATELTITAA